MHSFEVHSIENACRKKVRLGMEQIKYKGKNENFIRLGHRRCNNGTTEVLLRKDTVTESLPRTKRITRFREELTKKVGTLLKGEGNK